MSQFPTETEIIKAIESSDYLMKQEVGNILEKHGYHIKTNSSFKDIDTEILTRNLSPVKSKRKKEIGNCKNNLKPSRYIYESLTLQLFYSDSSHTILSN